MTLRLNQLELCDVGVFCGEMSFDLSGMMVGIVGSNGKGKSTILSMIHYCMTGDTSRLGQSEAIALRRIKDSQPYGRMLFEVPGSDAPASITRWLPDGSRNGRRRLVHDNQSWTMQEEVKSKIESWTGVSPKVLSDFVFVEQGRLTAVVDDRPSERAELLHRLFGIAEAEKVRAAAVDYLAKLPGQADPQVLAALRARYVESESEFTTAQSELDAVAPPVDVSSDRELVREHTKQLFDRNEIARLNGLIEGCLLVVNRPIPEQPDPSQLRDLEALASQWRFYNSWLVRNRDLVSRVSKLREQVARLLDQIPGHLGDAPQPTQELIDLRERKFSLEAIRHAPNLGGVCPVCSGVLDPEMSDRDAAVYKLEQLQKMEQVYKSEVLNHSVAVARRADAHTAWFERNKDLEILENQVANDIEPIIPDVSESDIHLLTQSHDRALVAHTQSVRQKTEAERLLLSYRSSLRMISVGKPISDDAAATCSNRIKVADALESQRRELAARAQALRESFEGNKKLLIAAEDAGRTSESLRAHRARVAAVRDTFHRGAAPALSVRSNLVRLSADLNKTLAALRASFRITVEDNGEFMASFSDGTSTSTVRASRISKGERAVLGLAWTIAAADQYAPQVGVLCLDEPTDGLDRERLMALRTALAAWRESDQSRQLIVVTHERSLLGVFDQVIDLG